MKLKALVILWSVSVTAAASGVGYELIQHRLDYLEQRFADGLERLVTSVSKNEGKVDELTATMVANNSRLMDMIDNLKDTVTNNTEIMSQNQKSLDSLINTFKQNASNVANNTRTILETQAITSCKTPSSSGVFKLKFPSRSVYCEMETFGGGWLVIQQRIHDFKLNFNRSWSEYRDGFGVVGRDDEFWFGNEAIHQITSSGQYELAVELKKYKDYYYARYSEFHVAGESDKYRLTVGGYSGTLDEYFRQNNNMQFSTYDSDNDLSVINCAADWSYSGGWWYNSCGYSNLNDERPYLEYFGTYSRMMIRRK